MHSLGAVLRNRLQLRSRTWKYARIRLRSISEYAISRWKRAFVGSTGSLGVSVEESVAAAAPLALEFFFDLAFERFVLLLLLELTPDDAEDAVESTLAAASLDEAGWLWSFESPEP
jgi:hypothetical protein